MFDCVGKVVCDHKLSQHIFDSGLNSSMLLPAVSSILRLVQVYFSLACPHYHQDSLTQRFLHNLMDKEDQIKT